MPIDVTFQKDGAHYQATLKGTASDIGAGNPSVGCHSRVVTGLGQISFEALNRKRTPQSVWERVGTEYDAWGQLVTHPDKILLEYFTGKQEELRDLVYNKVAESYNNAGVVIFSDHINAGAKYKATTTVVKIAGLAFSPASFALWLHRHRKQWGPVYASPACGNPMHKSPECYSLVQVFTWIPKVNAWTIASDLGEIPCVRDPEYTSNTAFENNALKEIFRGVPTEQLKKEMSEVTYL